MHTRWKVGARRFSSTLAWGQQESHSAGALGRPPALHPTARPLAEYEKSWSTFNEAEILVIPSVRAGDFLILIVQQLRQKESWAPSISQRALACYVEKVAGSTYYVYSWQKKLLTLHIFASECRREIRRGSISSDWESVTGKLTWNVEALNTLSQLHCLSVQKLWILIVQYMRKISS
jgi:hypothetical protein